ncbi:MAG: hypothetical protein DI551_05235 [Micavibrio aeruginosavorus]|uniref:DUF3486 domain-containing protein n=1 Tax=Micavibrio aeruginosavorus TaxID=349221 RepID=A0A2W5N1M0_9BACT|nr:MAG: hypothetical protein DI551_05235 [Micavibrio aeruginosavorus]
MAKPSSITRQPKEIRDKIAELREAGKTIDEILECLNSLGADVSRSALGRHIQKADKVAEKILHSRQMAEAITSKFGDEKTSQVARVNLEMMHSLVLNVLTGADDGKDVVLKPMDAMLLSTALEKLSKAQKSDVETAIKTAVETERRAAMQKAADVVSREAKKQGLSTETVTAIRSSILGVE